MQENFGYRSRVRRIIVKRALRITGVSMLVVLFFAMLGAASALSAAYWDWIPGMTMHLFGVEYDAGTLAGVGPLEWVLLFIAATLAFCVAIIVGLFAAAFGSAVVVFALFFVFAGLAFGALALISPILLFIALVWAVIWAVRRYSRRNASVASA